MSEHDALDRLRTATRKTTRGMVIMGVGTALLGGFMIVLHALELDADAADMGTAALAALYGFAILFLLVGALMIYVALFKLARKSRSLIGALVSEPHRIRKITHQTIQSKSAPGDLGKVHQLVFDVDGDALTLTVKAADVEAIVVYARTRAPAAFD